MNSKSVAFHHFGCKVNYAEASSIARQFQEKGFEIRSIHDPADIYVISSCAVTSVAEKKCRAAIRQAHKKNPKATIAIVGCLAELKPDALLAMEGVDLVLGHSRKFHLPEALENPGYIPEKEEGIYIPAYSSGDRTRSFLKIQDGCNYCCAYCTIPLARGKSRSDTISNVVNSAREIGRHGIHEIVLTGVNIGDFGTANGESLYELIRELDSIDEISRFRISSIEPDLLSDEIIEFVAGSQRFLPHFHIPLQSGCNKTLKAMRRRYDRELYAGRIEKIRALLPNACIAADVIVGFPGETDIDFVETMAFIKQLDISYLHVFSYSIRDHTFASTMPGRVPEQVTKHRSEKLHRLSEEKKKHFYHQNQGCEVRVLYESDNTNGYMHGFSENYIKVKTPFNPLLMNTIRTVKLIMPSDDGCFIDEITT